MNVFREWRAFGGRGASGGWVPSGWIPSGRWGVGILLALKTDDQSEHEQDEDGADDDWSDGGESHHSC